jgi:hypothetical protein
MAGITTHLSILTLNVNGCNSPIKRVFNRLDLKGRSDNLLFIRDPIIDRKKKKTLA